MREGDGIAAEPLQTLQAVPRAITLYASLGERFAKMNEPAQAQRAYTSVVDALPNESESHAALADIFQKQNRWADAAEQWTQVARIRSLEPTGLLGLAAAQVRLKQWDQATETVRKLRTHSWPSRFGDVDSQARELQRQIDRSRE